MLAQLTSPQVAEWLAYASIEGIGGEEAEKFRAGQICAAVGNFSMAQRKEPWRADDFFPSLAENDPEPILMENPEDQANLIMAQVFGTTRDKAYGKK